eukprot:TRINITY_DN4728_c0_g1_i1.p1 TRINITY_DN4728_c0_g1~~TRINITY_DN4728_c0_g1_i1.p1  ORF type:complete len:483 (-),score=231.40 TRINITY_DN4728_c0_g1_i1:149-1597(-)
MSGNLGKQEKGTKEEKKQVQKSTKASKEEQNQNETKETNPVSILLSKKIRNLRKKVANFENLQKKLVTGHPLTEDQKKILSENPYHVKLIEDLEKLKQEVTPLLQGNETAAAPSQPAQQAVPQAVAVAAAPAPQPVVTERIVERWNDQAIFSLVNLLHFHFDQDPNAFDNLDSQVCDATHEVADSIAHLQSGLTTDSSVLLVKQYLTAGDNEKHNGVTFADMRALVNAQTSKQWPASQKTSTASSDSSSAPSTAASTEEKKKEEPAKQESATGNYDWYSESEYQAKDDKSTESTPSTSATAPQVPTSPQKKKEGNQGKKQHDNEGFVEVEGKEGSGRRGNNRGRGGKGYRNSNESRQPQPDSEGFVEVEGREGSGRRGGNYRNRGGFRGNDSRPPRNHGGEQSSNQGGESPSGEPRTGGRGGNRPRGAPRGGNVGGEGGNATPKENRPPRPQGEKPRGNGGRGRGRGEGQPQQQQQQPVNPQ